MGAGDLQHMIDCLLCVIAERPGACDTFDGVRAFWLGTDDVETLRRAVQHLVRAGHLREVAIGGRTHYRVAEPIEIRK